MIEHFHAGFGPLPLFLVVVVDDITDMERQLDVIFLPVYWVLNRSEEQPFEEEVAGYGKVYHVGSPEDVLKLMEDEKALM